MLKQEFVFNVFIAMLSILGLFDIIYTFTGVSAQLGVLYPAAHVLLNIIGFVAISFIWSSEKWANWLFIGVILAHLGLDLLVGGFQPMKLLLLPVVLVKPAQKPAKKLCSPVVLYRPAR